MDLPISIYMPFQNKDDVLRSFELGVGKIEKKDYVCYVMSVGQRKNLSTETEGRGE